MRGALIGTPYPPSRSSGYSPIILVTVATSCILGAPSAQFDGRVCRQLVVRTNFSKAR